MGYNKNKYRLGLVGVLLLFCLVVFPTMGKVSLWDIDEGRYLVPAKMAIEHHKWLIPEYNGSPRVVKPPLMVWLVAGSSLIFNKGKVTELYARLPSAIAAMGVLILLYLLVSRCTQREDIALLSTFLLSTSLLFIKHARFALTDMVLLFFVVFAILLGYLAVEKQNGLLLTAAFFICGLGYMDKGPVAIVIPAGTILLWSISQRRFKEIPWKWVPLGITIFAAVALWWPFMVGKSYWQQFILSSNIKRAFSNPSWKTSTFFYLLNFPTHFIMASCAIPATAYTLKRYSKQGLTLFFIWFAFVFVLFSIADTKRSSYILPLYPAASAIVAWAFVKLKNSVKADLWYGITAKIALATFTGIYLWCLFMLFRYRAHAKLYLLTFGMMALTLGLYVALKKKLLTLFLTLCLLFALSYTNIYQPIADKLYHSPKACIEKMKAVVQNQPLYIYGSLRANEYWYWQRRAILPIEQAKVPSFYFYTRKKRVKIDIPHRKILCCSYQRYQLCLYKAERKGSIDFISTRE